MPAELFHADRPTDGQTDMTKLIVTVHNFANAPKNIYVLPTQCIYILRMVLISNSNYFPVQNQQVSITRRSAHCAVRAEFLNTIQVNLCF